MRFDGNYGDCQWLDGIEDCSSAPESSRDKIARTIVVAESWMVK